MKKFWGLMLALIMLCGAAQAQAQDVTLAAERADLEPLARYAAWTEEDGVWRVYSNETAAALSRLGQENGTMAYFCLQLSGERATGLIQPELVVYYIGTRMTMADTVTLAADDMRYDFRAARSEQKLGRNTVEVLCVPLDAAGIEAVRRTASAERVAVQLTGERTYFFELDAPSESGTSQSLQAASLKGLSVMLDELDKLGATAYGLWDLNADRWERLYGFRPEMAQTKLVGKIEGETIRMDNRLEMLSHGDTGNAVRALQTLLVEKGYIFGTQDGSFGDGTDRAVRAARRYYGLMENGLADRALVACLSSDAAVEKAEQPEQAALQALGGVCELSLDRCWFADAFASKGGAIRAASNEDNTLFIAEGRILNTSAVELTFYWQLAASLKLGEVSYGCTVVCEADAGRRLDASLLPLAEGRMVIYAEIPERIAGEGDWLIELTAGGESLTFAVSAN